MCVYKVLTAALFVENQLEFVHFALVVVKGSHLYALFVESFNFAAVVVKGSHLYALCVEFFPSPAAGRGKRR